MADASQLDQRSAAQVGTVLKALRAETGGAGYQQILDARHSATYLARGPTLLVSFERICDTFALSPDGLPIGLDFAEEKNWSVLHCAADGDTWFRAPAVYAFMDDLVDDAFFEEFDRVVFYGAGMGGYAAAAYSVVAPGARVLALSPQATLDRERAGWDTRFPAARRLEFSHRYAYAPDMLEAARAAWILYDPYQRLDAMHASLFTSPVVTRLKCPRLGPSLAPALHQMDLLHQLIERAAEGTLAPDPFYRLLRARRHHMPFLCNLASALDDRQSPRLTALFCAYAQSRSPSLAFRRRLDAARAALADQGDLPDWLPDR